MAIDFNQAIGANSQAARSTSNSRRRRGSSEDNDQPDANLWLNIGYIAEGAVKYDDGSTEDRFVSLPRGLPFDTMPKIDTSSINNADYAAFQAARNLFHDKISALAESLQPGEDIIVMLPVQIRRVNGPKPAPAVDETNPYVREIEFKTVSVAT